MHGTFGMILGPWEMALESLSLLLPGMREGDRTAPESVPISTVLESLSTNCAFPFLLLGIA